ncbi:hypothetical protein DFH08DRAFT_713523 [Mycena albidolilacea]|uniref:Uncharacterized protein n=1 Tax=Mycena albidolilacea TaxID=1033008 RepID=A0AAD7EFC4_9AGAR|nr:hypothetical protein DFH08DRAFT_713523 [Mycena albidolilacea]
MLNSERAYVDLIFRVTKKYAAWDPEIAVKAGDYGRITRGPWSLAFWRKNGTFVHEGNIYLDGKAEKYGIAAPVEYGRHSEGQTWITSLNATRVDTSFSAGGLHPLVAQCNAKAAFKFSSGCGAVLAMENPIMTIIDPPGALKGLLEDPSMRGMVVVSEVHSCSSYARLLTTEEGDTVMLGLHVEPPVPGIGSAGAIGTWVRHGTSGNFKTQVNPLGERAFYPLFRLVSRSEEQTSTGIGRANSV